MAPASRLRWGIFGERYGLSLFQTTIGLSLAALAIAGMTGCTWRYIRRLSALCTSPLTHSPAERNRHSYPLSEGPRILLTRFLSASGV
jgi:hypothetical protein